MHGFARLLLLGAVGCGTTTKVAKLVVTGESETLCERPPTARASSPESPQILFLALNEQKILDIMLALRRKPPR